MPPARRKIVEAALRERAERLERELAVERAARLAHEQRAARCLEPLRALDREDARSPEADEVVTRLREALAGLS